MFCVRRPAVRGPRPAPGSGPALRSGAMAGELSTAATPRLLHFRVSHYNEKVRWALDFKRWAHRRKALVPGFHVAGLQIKTGQRKVPVLEIEGVCG